MFTHARTRARLAVAVVAASMLLLAAPAAVDAQPVRPTQPTLPSPPAQKDAASQSPPTTAADTSRPRPDTATPRPQHALEQLLPDLSPMETETSMSDLSGRYATLSGALVEFYAARDSVPVADFVAANNTNLADLLGRPGVATLSVKDGADLHEQLTASGAASDPRGLGGFDAWAADMSAKGSTFESRLAASAASWAASSSAPRMPDLAAPNVPALASSGPGLMFGLLYDRSLTAMVTDHPDLFASALSSPAGSPEAAKAWRQSMVNAVAATQADPTAGMANPCYGSMLGSMATGVMASTPGCGGCAAVGTYLHGRMASLFDPGSQASSSAPLPPEDMQSVPAWQRGALLDANPGLEDSFLSNAGSIGLSSSNSAGQTCAPPPGTASTALGSALPGVFSSLGR